jgi:hypothetical protein
LGKQHLLSIILGLFLSLSMLVQGTTDAAIDGVEFKNRDGCYWIELDFEQPVQYLNHFPYSAGDALRIHIKELANPIVAGSGLSVGEYPGFQSEPPFTLEDIEYNPGIIELRFSQSTPFAIWQDNTLRRIVVSVPGPDEDLPCRQHN